MSAKKVKRYNIVNQEVVLNLWAYSDEQGNIQRLAGKAYVIDGEDPHKLNLLKQLSCTDFLSTKWYPVPKNFNLSSEHGNIKGVAQAAHISDPYINGLLFSDVIDAIANSLPEQLRMSSDGYQRFRLVLSESPLCVTTVVIEESDGQLVPMVSG